METRKIIERITLKGWVTGSGWSYEQGYDSGNGEREVTQDEIDSLTCDWSFWDTEGTEDSDDADLQIVVAWYATEEDIASHTPLASWSIWQSELIAEREGG